MYYKLLTAQKATNVTLHLKSSSFSSLKMNKQKFSIAVVTTTPPGRSKFILWGQLRVGGDG